MATTTGGRAGLGARAGAPPLGRPAAAAGRLRLRTSSNAGDPAITGQTAGDGPPDAAFGNRPALVGPVVAAACIPPMSGGADGSRR